MKNYHVNVKDSLICHVRDEHDFSNMKKLMKKIIWCKFHWQNKIDYWRQNHVWIRNDENVENHRFRSNVFSFINDNNSIEQLQVIVIIQNSNRRKNWNQTSMTYCEILIKLLRSKNQNIDKIIDMFDLLSWINTTIKKFKILKMMKFYNMFSILQNVHVIFDDRDDYYVNNYADWNTYNTIYDVNFYDENISKIKKYRKFHRFE